MADFYLDVVQVGISCLLLVMIGYLMSYYKVFEGIEFKSMNQFTAKIGFPFLLFRSLASKKIREISFVPLVNALLMNSSAQITICLVFLFPFNDKLYTYLSTVVSSCYVNYVIIGIPIFSSIWGNTYNHVPAICSFCHYILLVPLFIIWSQLWRIKKEKLESGETSTGITFMDVLMAFYSALKTPLVIGNLIGLIWSAIGFDFPIFFQYISQYLGDCVVVYALVCIGRFLHEKSLVSCHWFHLLICLLIRFFVCPGFSLLWCKVLNVDNRTSRQCIVLSMLPAANAGFILASSVGIGANVASAMVFWTLIFIVPVLMIWFYVFDHLSLFPDIII